jgi:hypothetical protein
VEGSVGGSVGGCVGGCVEGSVGGSVSQLFNISLRFLSIARCDDSQTDRLINPIISMCNKIFFMMIQKKSM